MSTNINISVGDNKLLEQARLQQNASRQAQLEKEANQRLEAQATDARTKALAAQGLDANGNPLTGTRFQVPQLERRPAANRSDAAPSFLFVPTEGYGPNGIQGQSKNITNKLFSDRYVFTPLSSDPQKYFNADFVSNGGPSGAPALKTPPADIGTFPAYLLRYVVCRNSDVYLVDLSSTFNPPFALFVNTPPEPVLPLSYKLNKIKEYTAEVYMQVGAGSPPPAAAGSVSAGSGAYINIFPSGLLLFRISLYYNDIEGPRFGTFEMFYGTSGFVTFDNSEEGLPALPYGSWHHIAQVWRAGYENVYFDGQLISSTLKPSPFAELSDEESMLATVELYNGGVASLTTGIHGFRFTPKALYTGNFTPPPSITTLA